MTARRHVRALAAGPTLLALAALAACGGSGTGASAPASTPPRTPSSITSAQVSPSPSASSTPPTEVSSAPSAPSSVQPAPRTLVGRLLPAAELPGLGASSWHTVVTHIGEPATLFGTCQRFQLTSIGAMRVVARSYRSGSGSAVARAGNLVAAFPDAMTARRGYAVLQAWHDRCADKVASYPRHQVGPLRSIPVQGGTGDWYLVTLGPVPGSVDAAYLDAQGMTRVGNLVSLLSMRDVGKDYAYPAGQEPIVKAVRASAARLAGG